MGLARTYRLIEGSLVALFFLQASRVVFAVLISTVSAALSAGQVELTLVYAHLMLAGAVLIPWFAPRSRQALPAALSITAIIVALARVAVSVQVPMARLAAALIVIGVGGVYFAVLLRANWRTFVSAVVVGIVLDQLLRAHDAYDLSLRTWLDIPVAGVTLRFPWIVVQAVLSALMIAVSVLARRSARREPYEPAFVSIWGGLALGAFFAVETLMLSMPNVVARWTEVSYAGLVPWLILTTLLPLIPAVRHMMGETMAMFDDRLGGLVWLFALLMLIVVGDRLTGLGAAGALIVAQFMAVLLLWWVPGPLDPGEVEQSGPSISLGLAVFVALIYAYSLTFEPVDVLPWLRGQGLLVILVACALLTLPRLLWREEDPWMLAPSLPGGIAPALVAPAVVTGLVLSSLNADIAPLSFGNTLRVATYNMNGAYDAEGVFQLDLVARTVEASLADVVVLQEVDVGLPVSYGIDEAQFLARRLNMYQVFLPTAGHVRGLAILSRWPMMGRMGLLLPGDDSEQRGALSVVMQDMTSGRTITVIGAQLTQGSDEKRVEQLAALLGLIEQASPAVLAADLAAPPQDIVYQQLIATGFEDPDTVLGIEQGYTTPASYPTVRHDYLLVRGLIPLDSRQVDSAASDHRLVVIEAGWPND